MDKEIERYDLSKNSEGYPDPTAEAAILRCTPILEKKRIEQAEKQKRLSKLVPAIKALCDLAGFEVKGRIIFIDKDTREVYR